MEPNVFKWKNLELHICGRWIIEGDRQGEKITNSNGRIFHSYNHQHHLKFNFISYKNLSV